MESKTWVNRLLSTKLEGLRLPKVEDSFTQLEHAKVFLKDLSVALRVYVEEHLVDDSLKLSKKFYFLLVFASLFGSFGLVCHLVRKVHVRQLDGKKRKICPELVRTDGLPLTFCSPSPLVSSRHCFSPNVSSSFALSTSYLQKPTLNEAIEAIEAFRFVLKTTEAQRNYYISATEQQKAARLKAESRCQAESILRKEAEQTNELVQRALEQEQYKSELSVQNERQKLEVLGSNLNGIQIQNRLLNELREKQTSRHPTSFSSSSNPQINDMDMYFTQLKLLNDRVQNQLQDRQNELEQERTQRLTSEESLEDLKRQLQCIQFASQREVSQLIDEKKELLNELEQMRSQTLQAHNLQNHFNDMFLKQFKMWSSSFADVNLNQLDAVEWAIHRFQKLQTSETESSVAARADASLSATSSSSSSSSFVSPAKSEHAHHHQYGTDAHRRYSCPLSTIPLDSPPSPSSKASATSPHSDALPRLHHQNLFQQISVESLPLAAERLERAEDESEQKREDDEGEQLFSSRSIFNQNDDDPVFVVPPPTPRTSSFSLHHNQSSSPWETNAKFAIPVPFPLDLLLRKNEDIKNHLRSP